MSNRRVRLCWCLGITLILTPQLVGRAQTRVEEHRKINHNIRCTIQVQDREWTPATPAGVRGKVENLTEGFLEIHVQLFLYLSSKTSSAPRDRYWAPIDLFRDGPLSVDKQPMDKEGEVLAIKRFPSNSRSTRKVSQLISALMPDKFFGIEKSVQFGLHENYLLLSSQEATISAGSGNKER